MINYFVVKLKASTAGLFIGLMHHKIFSDVFVKVKLLRAGETLSTK